MAADLIATTAWQSAPALAASTVFQCKGMQAQVTDTDPAGDLQQGLNLTRDWGHTYPEGTVVYYRSDLAGTRIAMQAAG